MNSNRTVPVDLPRRYKAAYGPSIAGEVRKNVQLEAGERILYTSAVHARTNWLLRQPGFLELTSRRLILLEHHAFSADWILEIPRAAIVNVTAAVDSDPEWTTISYSDRSAVATIKIRPFAFRGRPLSQQSDVLLDALRAFHSGELSHASIEKSQKKYEAATSAPRYSGLALLALLGAVFFARVSISVANLPAEFHAKQAYDASSGCSQAWLAAGAQLQQEHPALSRASIAPAVTAFCRVQTMTVFRLWSTRGAPYQHVGLVDSSGKTYSDIGALNSVDRNLWWRMQPGEKVRVLLAGDQPAWISHDGDLFETRGNPDHNFWEQSTLMLVGVLVGGLFAALTGFELRRMILARRHAAVAQALS